MNMHRLLFVSSALCGLVAFTGCPSVGTNQPRPRLVNDWWLQNQPGTRATSFAQDRLLAGERTKPIWATIDPNNTFVTRVVVEWGDALPDQQADIPHLISDPLEPRIPSARFAGNQAAYSTAPETWALKLRLRGDGPDTMTPGGPRVVTGNAAIDTFLANVGVSSNIPPTPINAPGMPAGSRVSYTLHVFYKLEPRDDAPELGVYFPVRMHTFGPAIPVPARTDVQRATRLSWTKLGQVNNGPRTDLTDAGDEFDVELRVERAVSYPVTILFYSDPDSGLQVIDAAGLPVNSTVIQPAPSTSTSPYVQRWRVRVTSTLANGGVLWAHSSGYEAASLTLP